MADPREPAALGIARVQLVLDPITGVAVAGLEPMPARLDAALQPPCHS